MALEVVSVDAAGGCYQMLLRDWQQDTIQASFHAGCKDRITKEVRKGKAIILKNVGQFCISQSANCKKAPINLVVMDHCIAQIIK